VYPLDDLVRPYLTRLAPAVMVSYHYARQMASEPRLPLLRLPLLVDSGGFALLSQETIIVEERGLGVLTIHREGDETETYHPRDVLDLQERIADVAFTLDFPIPPGTPEPEAQRRQRLTIANALWASENRRRRDLPLFACVQAWDAQSARVCAGAYHNRGFDGIAIGGLVPRLRDKESVLSIIRAVREVVGLEMPLHAFGVGKPETVAWLYANGVDCVDSSAYVQWAAEGRLWGDPSFSLQELTATERLHLALCNLAMASGSALPLSAAPLLFRTAQLATPAGDV
jgi:tRNA-guanine family transglycosylase